MLVGHPAIFCFTRGREGTAALLLFCVMRSDYFVNNDYLNILDAETEN